jgi:hypothetical protein
MHWYDHEGNPHHTYVNKAGKECDTTLREARKHSWLPSVTGIISTKHSFGLENYKIEQMGKAMIKLLSEEDAFGLENDDDYKEIINKAKVLAKEESRIAAEKGTDIHQAIESYYKGDYNGKHSESVYAVEKLLDHTFGDRNWHSETSFAHHFGFGGTCDLHCYAVDPVPKSEPFNIFMPIVIDIKTKDWDDPENNPKGYSEQAMQLEACANGIDQPDALIYNVFVSRTTPGLVSLYQHNKEGYFSEFCSLLNVWKRENKYNASFERKEVPIL